VPDDYSFSKVLPLLNRLAEPTSGTVLLHGRPLPELDVLALRRRVGLVGQQPVLLIGRVLDELRVGSPGLVEGRAAATALIPTIDSTRTVGLITLPGAMTGLILAGVEPFTAIHYQIVVMYMMLAAAALASLTAARLAERALFDDAHRLRWITAG
jgi:UDP-glucose/iron transport system permease protein